MRHFPLGLTSVYSILNSFLYLISDVMNESFVVNPADESFEIIEEKYECSVCPFTSKFKHNLKRHERRHLKEQMNPPDAEDCRLSILCDQCARPYKTKRGLQLHVQTKHLKVFKFKCSVCPGQFNMLSAFRGHLASHHKELKEKCSLCGAEFQYKQTLKDHKKKAHNISQKKNYTCEECQQNFSCRDTLLQHRRGMHGGKAFDCPRCNKTYRWRSSLAYHTATVRHSP